MPLKVEEPNDYEEEDVSEDVSNTSKILSKISLSKIRQHPWSKHIHDVLHITGLNLQQFFNEI